MEIISQKTENIQQKTLENVLHEVPIVLVGSKNEAFILVKDVSEALTEFLRTGIVNCSEQRVFPDAYEQEIIERCCLSGLCYTYRSQPFEYKRKTVTIKYLQIYNPHTNVNISLVPWFLLKGRPYPIFVYLYAIWHYYNSKHKSMQHSAMATGRIFGIPNFNKSTVCRSIKVMKRLISEFQMERPLSVEELDVPSSAEIISRVLDLLNNCPTIDALVKTCQVKTGRLPPPVRDINEISYAFNNIPEELSNVYKTVNPARAKIRDSRSRPTRKRKRKYEPKQKTPNYVASWRIEQICQEFIAVSKSMVLDAAITFRRLLN